MGEFIVKNRKWFYMLSVFIVAVSLFLFIFKTPSLSIEFTGGISYELACQSTCQKEELSKVLDSVSVKSSSIVESKDGLIVKIGVLDQQAKSALESAFAQNGFEIQRSYFIGPSIGDELKKKAMVAIVAVAISIILFVAYAFREVSRPISSWVYGLIAILALLHDMIVPAGFYSILAQAGAEIDTLFVVAMLAILGYSVNDTIVIFDRVRERLAELARKKTKEPFEQTVALALQKSIARSINTSVTTALVLIALLMFGPEVTYNFVLVLLVGVLAGTYSSLFLAAPLLVTIYNYKKSRGTLPSEKANA